jgi:hypothetical protein
MGGHRRGRRGGSVKALGSGEGAPVVTGGARGVLQHWGMTGSEAGWLIDDDELRRVELTERG